MIKHIFSDMDGTLLNSKGKISDQNVKGIIDSQIPFTLVSARAPMEMAETIDRLNLTDPQIAFNGGLIFKQDKTGLRVIKEDPLDIANVQTIMKKITQNFPSVSCSCYGLNNWYSERIDAGIKYESNVNGKTPQIVDYQSFFKPDTKIYKIMLITFDETLIPEMERVINSWNLDNLSVKQTCQYFLEITSQKAQKSKGIEYIRNLKKLFKNEMAAFGDGHNDLPMFQSVGLPIVMKNALPEIKSYGRYVTKTNDENGVAFGITHYLTK